MFGVFPAAVLQTSSVALPRHCPTKATAKYQNVLSWRRQWETNVDSEFLRTRMTFVLRFSLAGVRQSGEEQGLFQEI